MCGVTEAERNKQLEVIRDQHSELYAQSEARIEVLLATVTCPCGGKRGITKAVRCLYCDIWYCEMCAEQHFGQTRKEYRDKNPINLN